MYSNVASTTDIQCPSRKGKVCAVIWSDLCRNDGRTISTNRKVNSH